MERGIKMVGDDIKRSSEVILRGFDTLLLNTTNFLLQSKKTLELLNPTRQLAQGYSIVKIGGKVLRSKKDAKKGDKLDILVADGIINTQII